MNQSNTFSVLLRVARESILPHSKTIIIAVCLMVVTGAMTGVQAWLVKPALDKIFLEKDRAMLLIIPIAILIVMLVNGICTYLENLMMAQVNMDIVFDMQKRLYRHFIGSDLATFNARSSGAMLSNITNDAVMVSSGITSILTIAVSQVITIISLFIVMFNQNTTLSIIACFGIPLAGFPIYKLGRKLRNVSNRRQIGYEHFMSRINEALQSIRIVKAYNREEYENSRMAEAIFAMRKIACKINRLTMISSPLMELIGGIAIAAIIWYGGMQVINGVTTPGAFFSFIAAMVMAYKPLKTIAGINNTVQMSTMAAIRVFAMLDTNPSIMDSPTSKDFILREGKVELKNIDFAYNPDMPILQNLSIVVPPRKMIALVGHSGGGKSTIMSLILRFYDVNNGAIEIDGQDIRSLKLSSFRDYISIVNQDISLFDDSVLANIRYGKLDATDEEVMEAAKLAAAHDFILGLENGYQTMIGQNGCKISGGQKQRIAIARAFLKNAPILLLDEATSSLDQSSERLIQESLSQLIIGKTVIVIAHRLSTVVNADQIYVIDAGKVAEHGTHKELLAKNGVYGNLYSAQINK